MGLQRAFCCPRSIDLANPLKDAAINVSAMIAGIALNYWVIAILPFLMAVAGIALIWWIIGMCPSGDFGIRR